MAGNDDTTDNGETARYIISPKRGRDPEHMLLKGLIAEVSNISEIDIERIVGDAETPRRIIVSGDEDKIKNAVSSLEADFHLDRDMELNYGSKKV